MSRKLLLALLLAAGPAAAQSTGSPVFHAPYRPFERHEFGANVSDYGNITIEGFYGFSESGAKWDVSLRAGIQDNGGCCKSAALAGVDARFRVIEQSRDFPLDGAIIAGAGVRLISGGSTLFIPFGLSLGRRVNFSHSTVSLVPYAEPVLGPRFGNGDTDLIVALGLGADLRINHRVELRVAVGIGDIGDFSVGFALTR